MKLIIKLFLIFSFFNISSSADFTTVGNANLEEYSTNPDLVNYNDYYRLTSNGNDEKGAIWMNDKVDLNNPILFEFIANFGDDDIGADGIAFVLHKDRRSIEKVIGAIGANIGYADNDNASNANRVEKSIALEFDTYHNYFIQDYINYDDIEADHFDIRRNGHTVGFNGFSKISLSYDNNNIGNIEVGKKIQIQIYWNPGSPDPSKGKLTVFFNCEKIYETNSSFDIDEDLGWTSLEDVNVGLTAATAANVNFHRVILTVPKLELSSTPICGNFKLNARFPALCGTVQYRWTAADGSTNGLINPNSKSPIAFKSGTYTCDVDFLGSTFSWDSQILNNYQETITVDLDENLPTYSYQNLYGNSYKFGSQFKESIDGVCGAQLSQDCGFIISALSYYEPSLNNSLENPSIWLLKTNYLGDLLWSKNYIATRNGLNLETYDPAVDGEYQFMSVSHHLINDYKILDTDGTECENINDNESVIPIKENLGYLVSGEMTKAYTTDETDNIDPKDDDAFLMKIDNNGEKLNSIAIDLLGSNDKVKKTQLLEDNRYITLLENKEEGVYTHSKGSFLGICYDYNGTDFNAFNFQNKIKFEFQNSCLGFVGSSDFITIPKNNINPISKDYYSIFAIPYKDANNNNKIGVLLLDDIFANNASSVLKTKISIPNESFYTNQIKILHNIKDNNVFYIVSRNQISKFNITNNWTQIDEVYTYKFQLGPNAKNNLGGAVLINGLNEDKISFVVSESYPSQYNDYGPVIVTFNLNTEIFSTIRYINQNYGVYDNLLDIDNGLVSAGWNQSSSTESDVELISHKNSSIGICTEVPSISQTKFFYNTENIEFISINDILETEINFYDPLFQELEHYPIEKNTLCNTAISCDCEDISNKSLEFYTVPLERTNNQSDCCFEVYVKNTGNCKLDGFEFNITSLINSSYSNLPSNVLIQSLDVNTTYLLGEVCLTDEFGMEELSLTLEKNGLTCKDSENEDITFKTKFFCKDDCCSFINVEFIPVNQNGVNCCFVPLVLTTDEFICDISDVVINYYDSNNNLLSLNSENQLCLDPNDTEIHYTIEKNGIVCSTITEELECGKCDCPPNIMKSWIDINIEKNANTGSCPGSKCLVTFGLNVDEEFINCFPNVVMSYVVKDFDGNILSTNTLPPYTIAQTLPPICINSGASISFSFKFYPADLSGDGCEVIIEERSCSIVEAELPQPCNVLDLDVWKKDNFIFSIDGCEYIIDYSYRITSSGHQDVQLTRIVKKIGNCPTNLSDDDIFIEAVVEAIIKIIKKDRNFEPQINKDFNCIDTWRVIQNSCWAKLLIGFDELFYELAVPCNSDCCARIMEVCYVNCTPDHKCDIQITDKGYVYGITDFNCSADGNIDPNNKPEHILSETQCEDISCDVYEDMTVIREHDDYGNMGKQSVDDSFENISNYNQDVIKPYLSHKTNLRNEKLEIILLESDFENLEINIFNLTSTKVLSNEYNNTNNIKQITVNIESLNSGCYLYQICYNGNIIATDKFIIIK